MDFSMNIYFDPEDMFKETPDITKSVFERMEVNDCQDLYDCIEYIDDTEKFERVEDLIAKSTIEELKPFLTVNEESVRYDECESGECDFKTLAYLVDVKFDVDKFLEVKGE